MRIIGFTGLLLVSILGLWAHADRLPTPPGPAYSGFMPGDWQYNRNPEPIADCD